MLHNSYSHNPNEQTLKEINKTKVDYESIIDRISKTMSKIHTV